jgi:glutamine---fructose-6-phosphate transaminase (isomerizing)
MNPDDFLADILAEPATLDRVLAEYDRPASLLGLAGGLSHRRVVLIGMGSSRYAALNAASVLRSRGVAAVVEYASSDVGTRPGPDVLAIVISASGRSPETLDAFRRHKGISRTVAVVNVTDSPLALEADLVLPMLAGQEKGGVACRSFQASLAILLRLAGVQTSDLAAACAAQARLFENRDSWIDELLRILDDERTTHTIAPASRLASALQSALMLREGPRVPAAAAETGDWSHVDVYLSKYPGYRAVMFAGSAYQREALDWLVERRSTIVVVGVGVPEAALHIPFDSADLPFVSQLVETSVMELAAATWWQRRLAAGDMPA